MKVPVLKTCFWKLSLRTGSLITGYLYLVGSLVFTGVFAVPNYHAYVNAFFFFVFSVDFCISAELITSILLLFGIYKEKSAFIMSWLVATSIVGIVIAMDFMDDLYFLFAYYSTDTLLITLLTLTILAAEPYLLLVVYNYRKSINESETTTNNVNQIDNMQLV